MDELLLRIQQLCFELNSGTLIITGIIATIMGLFMWLGGVSYSGTIVGLLGAGVGSGCGLIASKMFNFHPAMGMAVGAAVLAILAVVMKNLVIIILTIVIFAATTGTGYLSHILDKTAPTPDSYNQQTPTAQEPGWSGTNEFSSQLQSIQEVNERLEAINEQRIGFQNRLDEVLEQTWEDTREQRPQLLVWAVLGGVGGLILVWFIKRIIMALCCSVIGTTATIIGVNMLFIARGTPSFSKLQENPQVLPILATAMVIFGWATQIFQLALARAKKEKSSKEIVPSKKDEK